MEFPHALHNATPVELKQRIEAERRERPFLLYRDGGGAQHIVDLGHVPDRLTIGRSPTNGVVLGWDAEVSRVHASIERLGDVWTLVDDGRARNGSFINGARVQGRARLRDGSAIRVGRTVVVFRSPTGRESMRTKTAERVTLPDVTEAQLRVLVAFCRPCVASSLAVPASNREIADELVVGVETVKSHIQALYVAFGLVEIPPHHKRAALVRRALDIGLLPQPGPDS